MAALSGAEGKAEFSSKTINIKSDDFIKLLSVAFSKKAGGKDENGDGGCDDSTLSQQQLQNLLFSSMNLQQPQQPSSSTQPTIPSSSFQLPQSIANALQLQQQSINNLQLNQQQQQSSNNLQLSQQQQQSNNNLQLNQQQQQSNNNLQLNQQQQQQQSNNNLQLNQLQQLSYNILQLNQQQSNNNLQLLQQQKLSSNNMQLNQHQQQPTNDMQLNQQQQLSTNNLQLNNTTSLPSTTTTTKVERETTSTTNATHSTTETASDNDTTNTTIDSTTITNNTTSTIDPTTITNNITTTINPTSIINATSTLLDQTTIQNNNTTTTTPSDPNNNNFPLSPFMILPTQLFGGANNNNIFPNNNNIFTNNNITQPLLLFNPSHLQQQQQQPILIPIGNMMPQNLVFNQETIAKLLQLQQQTQQQLSQQQLSQQLQLPQQQQPTEPPKTPQQQQQQQRTKRKKIPNPKFQQPFKLLTQENASKSVDNLIRKHKSTPNKHNNSLTFDTTNKLICKLKGGMVVKQDLEEGVMNRNDGGGAADSSMLVLPEPDESISLEDLEQYAKSFKKRRIELGYTQGDVGMALGRMYGNDFSQTTISRFEALNLSFKNMCKLKPLLQLWLTDADQREHLLDDEGRDESGLAARKRKKRTIIDTAIRVNLEQMFCVNSKPSSEELSFFADQMNMEKDVIRVWFCNRRQKEKRISLPGNFPSPNSPPTIYQPTTFNQPNTIYQPTTQPINQPTTQSILTSHCTNELDNNLINSIVSSLEGDIGDSKDVVSTISSIKPDFQKQMSVHHGDCQKSRGGGGEDEVGTDKRGGVDNNEGGVNNVGGADNDWNEEEMLARGEILTKNQIIACVFKR